MEKLIIDGGHALSGNITPSGNKNAALPLLAACMLTDDKVVLHNVPDILDVRTMRALLESMGIEIQTTAPDVWQIQAREVRPAD